MTDSTLQKGEVDDQMTAHECWDAGGLPWAVQLLCLVLFVAVVYELLHPHVWLLVSAP